MVTNQVKRVDLANYNISRMVEEANKNEGVVVDHLLARDTGQCLLVVVATGRMAGVLMSALDLNSERVEVLESYDLLVTDSDRPKS